MDKKLRIVLVEDNATNQNRMKRFLTELFPCEVITFSHGIEATNFLLAPTSVYDLVILDGKLRSLPHTLQQIPVDGPEVAAELRKKGIRAKVVLWTNDPDMLARFDEVYDGKRLPEIEKPCRKENIEVILRPIVKAILSGEISPEMDAEIDDYSISFR
ncbi:Response regulator receiver domain protein [Legionella nautarum]|uniref:Response regulator receiver domain protein n=1 Tax=Legionella nautarum TaxID=45070 RepID=A0A0W0WV86_9GAMM|nr:response regulator [Legionella nautarum]KTD36222.1 Response regulator receiver domain protein [Legionella nautarum]